MIIAISLIVFVLFPALLIWGEKSVKIIQWLSPAFFCYAGGIALGNIIDIPQALTDNFINITVVLAIPLLLFQTDIPRWLKLAPTTLLSYGLWIVVVFTASCLGFYFMGEWVDEPATMSAMATSVYIGGTANMAAVNLALQADNQLFVEMNLSDLMLSGVYLVIILSFGQRILLLFLRPFEKQNNEFSEEGLENQFALLSIRQKIIKIAGSIGFGAIVLGISMGLSFLITGKVDQLIVILSLTVFGLLASTIKKAREWEGSYETGEYLFLIFCVAVGAKVDLAVLMDGAPIVLLYMVIIAYGAIIVHALLAYFFKIDADTVLITSSAGIFGPPFIGPIANAIKNREVVASGMTLGVINMAVGNFAGILVHTLLI